ncbi:MAG: SIMPL domain-containing protein, partial [Geodermatophilaceae bacterium]|nr:SIMPL domain-containing protein [Geodermatophilaceae bacterium]
MTVTGRGEIEVAPDQAILDLGGEARAASFDDALAGAGRAVFEMTEVLRGHGVGDADLRTQGPHTWTITDDGGRVDAYVCSLQLTARVGDPAVAGRWLAECAVAAGDTGRANGVRFAVRDRA